MQYQMPFFVGSWPSTVVLTVLICCLSMIYGWRKHNNKQKRPSIQNVDIFKEERLCAPDDAKKKSRKLVEGLPLENIPGPVPTPGLGNLIEIGAAGNYYTFLKQLHKTYGSIAKFYVKDKLLVSLADPELFRKTARTSNRPAELFEAFSPLMTKDSLAFMNGQEGRRRHMKFETMLSHTALPMYIKGLQAVAQEFLNEWKSFASGSTVSIKQYSQPFAMKCILQQFFGDYFVEYGEQVVPMQENFDFCWYELESRSNGDIPESGSQRDIEFIKRRDEIFAIVGKALERRRKKPPVAGEEKLIDIVMNLFGDDEVTIKAELVNLIVGAYLSTGDLLTWILYFTSKYQDVQNKLYEEVLDVLGEDDASFESLPHLKYLKQVVDESLRASLLGTFVARESEGDMELAGYHIPPGVALVQAMGVVHMDSRFFPDPARFDPDRFSEEICKLRPPYAFVPFGFAGGRKCPGFRFAYLVCMEFISTVIKRYKITFAPGQKEPEVIHGLISCLKGDVKIVIEERR